MSTIFAQPPIIRGRRKSRGGYQGVGNRTDSPYTARKAASEEESTVLRHLVANGAPQNPQSDEPTAYYAEKVIENGHRPPSRQGFRNDDPFSAYVEDFLLHERFDDGSEDGFENPFAPIFAPDIRFNNRHGGQFGEGDREPSEKQKYDPYLPPQLFSPNFSCPDFPNPPRQTHKNQKDLFIDTATRELLVRADTQFRDHFARVTLGSEQQKQQTPQPYAPPGLGPSKIPTRKPRVYAPPAVSPPGIPCGPGPIQRPQPRPLPRAPAASQQVRNSASVEEPLSPPGLGSFKNNKPNPGALMTVEAPSVSCPGPHIIPEILQGHQRELDAYLNGVHDMFEAYHRTKLLSVRATRDARPGGSTNVNLGLAAGMGTAAVVPTHFNPIRRVSGAEVWLNVIADRLDRLRLGKRTSRADKKSHYLAMVFASHSGIVRPPRVASPFLLRLETE